MGIGSIDQQFGAGSYSTQQAGMLPVDVAAICLHLQKSDVPSSPLFVMSTGSSHSESVFYTSATGANVYVQQGSETTKLSEVIGRIESSFGLSKTDLAEVLSIVRKTVYNWLSGEVQPQKAASDRLFTLFQIAERLNASGISLNAQQLKKTSIDGKSVFDLLQEPSLDEDLVFFASSRVSLETMKPVALSNPFI